MKHKILTLLLLVFPYLGTYAQVKDTVTFAVLGNSISTYYDYIPAGYAIYYSHDREMKYGIQVGDTWWMQLSRISGMTFLANSSWSGSRVANKANDGSIANFTSNARLVSLSRNGIPDVVIIAGGTNDWGHNNIPLGTYSTTVFNDSMTFRGAYAMLLDKIQKRYPSMKIVCLSLFPRGDGLTVKNGMGWTQSEANASIKYIAKQFGATYVDCSTIAFSSNWNSYTLDRLHPTAAGHKLVADCIRKSLVSQKFITLALATKAEVDTASCLLDLSFDADGIVNKGTYMASIGKRGQATTLYDAQNHAWYGCTRASNSDFFYATYDQDSPLAEAFSQNVTWEALVRLDGLVNGSGSCDRACFLGNEQEGGWSFANTKDAMTFTYQHEGGNKSYIKCLSGDSIMVTGKFYHMVVTMDRASHVMRYFLNGQLIHTSTRCGADMKMPKCGSTIGKKGMWICLGGDTNTSTFRSACKDGAASTFVFARIYNGALTQKSAKALYNDYVRKFTEPKEPLTAGIIMDCQFNQYGAKNHSQLYGAQPIEMVGNVPTSYNSTLGLYEAEFQGERSSFFKFNMGANAGLMNAISDSYSVEVLCRADKALPSATMKVLGFTTGFGPALQMDASGKIGYATATQGFKSDGTAAKSTWTWTEAGKLTEEYTHYVISYDRLGHTSSLFVDGQLTASRSLANKECNIFEWAPTEWLAIGGDASGKYDATTSTGTGPFVGRIAMVRLWDKALKEADAKVLLNAISKDGVSYTIGSNGYASVCVPFVTILPEGIQAYTIPEIDATNAYLKPVGNQGEIVPYGTPLIVAGEPGRTFTLRSVDISGSSSSMEVAENLLSGTFATMTIPAGQGYYLKNTGTGIYRASADITIPAFSAYMPSTQKRLVFTFQDYVEYITGVNSLPEQRTTKTTYNLYGLPVQAWQKGIIIENGKKIHNH